MSRMTSTGQGAERTTWQPSAPVTPGGWRRIRSPSGLPSWRRRTRPSARRWLTCGRSWASARTSSPSTRPGTGPCRMAFRGAGFWRDGQRVSCLVAPPRTDLPDSSTLREAWTQLTHVLVRSCARVSASSRVRSVGCVRTRVCPFALGHFQTALASSFSSKRKKRKVPCFSCTVEPFCGCSCPSLLPALLRVPSYLPVQDPLLGLPGGPGKAVGLRFWDAKLLFLFNL